MFSHYSVISAGAEGEIPYMYFRNVFLIWVKDSSPGTILEKSNSHETPKDTVCLRVKGRVPEGIKQLPEISRADRDLNKRRASKCLILFGQTPNCNVYLSWSSPFSLILNRKLLVKASFMEEFVMKNLVVCGLSSSHN